MKFGRIYSMLAEGKSGGFHTIQFPLTCKLRVSNSGTPSASHAFFEIYNLTPEVRNDLFVDPFNTSIYRQIIFSAGYVSEASIPIIFQGNIYRCYSYRNGPDWITFIEALDGAFAIENGDINLTIPKKSADVSSKDYAKYIFEKIVSGMPRVKLGLIGTFDLDNMRGFTMCGNPWDLLVQKILPINAQAYIDQEVVNIVNQRDFIVNSADFDVISNDTGLLDTPKKQDGIITCRMIFEPRLEIMQNVKVISIEPGSSADDFKVMRIDHTGIISGAVGGSLVTEVTAFAPLGGLVKVA